MSDPVHHKSPAHAPADGFVELPRPTAAPLVISLGLALAAAGVATNVALLAVGAAVTLFGLMSWIGQLLPGRGHIHLPLVAEDARPQVARTGASRVEQMKSGKPGYRLRMPEQVHPLSAGVKGGIVGGLVMPLPALAYGQLSGHGIWYPVNLLAGMVLPGIGEQSVEQLEQFQPLVLVVAIAIHAISSVAIGLMYGVLLPMLPNIPKPLAWGGLLMPLLWTGVSYVLMGAVNPVLRGGVDWPWFVASQFVFGVVAAIVVLRAEKHLPPVAAGLLGGWVAGLLMAGPAVLWSALTRRGIWYPVNLLAGMVMPGLDKLPPEKLTEFHADWFSRAVVIHAIMSGVFGIIYGLLLPRVRAMPAAFAWGGLLMPLLWTAASYGLMGVVNPVLQRRVDWPWFIVSQFIFGVVAAIVVVRTEMVHIPPAGRGPDFEPMVEG